MDKFQITPYLILITLILGYIYFTNYVFFEDPSHIKSTSCNTTCDEILRKECYDSTKKSFYTCYDVNITLSVLFDDYNYIRSRTHRYIDYQIFCNNTFTLCYFDDRNIEDTLDIKAPAERLVFGIWGTLTGTGIMIMLVICFVLIA